MWSYILSDIVKAYGIIILKHENGVCLVSSRDSYLQKVKYRGQVFGEPNQRLEKSYRERCISSKR